MKATSSIRATVVAAITLTLACGPNNGEWTNLHRDIADCISVVFVKTAQPQDIALVLDEVTIVHGADDRSGNRLNPAIGSVVKTRVDDRTTYEVCFVSNARQQDKNSIRRDFEKSEFVDRIIDADRQPRTSQK
jgi:hypothetical protein